MNMISEFSLSWQRARWPVLALVLALSLVSLWPRGTSADYVELQRSASLHESADSQSAVLAPLHVGDKLTLVESAQTAGYYHVTGSGETGWVYRTFVRRFAGDIPGAASGGGGTPLTPPASGPLLDAGSFRSATCGDTGTAKSAALKALNRLKNRTLGPAANQVSAMTLEDLLFHAPDQIKWSPNSAIEVTGYVAEVKPGGNETCNCGATGPAQLDTHIVLVTDPAEEGTTSKVIVEVSPAWRGLMQSKGVDWSTATLKQQLLHHYVKVAGWMLFDAQHANAADNTNPNGAHNWRGTAWEIHPITALQVLPTPMP